MIYFIITLLSILLNINDASADSGSDRCSVQHCLCRVVPGEKKPPGEQASSQNRRGVVFFKYDSYEVDEQSHRKIDGLMELSKPGSINMSIIGYADACGASTYNLGLSRLRAQEVAKIVKSTRPNANISIITPGERGFSCPSKDDRRVDIVIHANSGLATRIEKIPADVYLVDASGSMWNGWRDWQDVIGASLKPNSKVYLSIMTGCRNGQKMNSVTPQSGTEIWYSYWKVLEYMKENETLLIISDFQSNYKLTSREASIIEKKAREKNITVYTVR